LICVPLIELVLLAATTVDLARGPTAGFGHGLAAAYLGFSIAFGHSLIRWADERFAYRFSDGPPPTRPPRFGLERARYEWREFAKALLARAIRLWPVAACDRHRRRRSPDRAARGWIGRLTLVLAIWAIWPVSHTLWPSKPKA
jgi:hypothetical protein